MTTGALQKAIEQALAPRKMEVKRRASGFLKYDYLVPAGPYSEQWDWDAFFMGLALSSEIPSEAIYLKNWTLNYLNAAGRDGWIPGCVTPEGADPRLKHMKPFLAQGALRAAECLKDFSWLLPHLKTMEKAITYRERHGWSKKYNLATWYDSMESGADNNVAALDFPNHTVAATDLNAFLYGEYTAFAEILRNLKRFGAGKFEFKARQLKNSIQKYLWNDHENIFYNLDVRTGKQIKRVSYSSVVPLWYGLINHADGRYMIINYVLNPKKLWARYGVRTLAKDDKEYNQKNIIKPYSNWQGPVWPIANYIYLNALLNYGFKKEAQALAKKIVQLCLNDIKKTGGMHENYNADTGAPLAAPNFISWNLLVGRMLIESKSI